MLQDKENDILLVVEDKRAVLFGVIFLIFAVLSAYLFITKIILVHETVTFETTETNQINMVKEVKKGTETFPSYVLLIWPTLFTIGGILAIASGFGKEKIENVFFGLAFLFFGSVLFFIFHSGTAKFFGGLFAILGGMIFIRSIKNLF